MAWFSTVSSFFLSQIGVQEFLPDININSNIITEESVVNILQSIIVKKQKNIDEKKQFSETTTATYVDLISKCTTLVDLDLEGCFYLSPSQVSQLLESLPNLTRLLVSPRWNRELHLWRKVYESYAKKNVEVGKDIFNMYLKANGYSISHFDHMYTSRFLLYI